MINVQQERQPEPTFAGTVPLNGLPQVHRSVAEVGAQLNVPECVTECLQEALRFQGRHSAPAGVRDAEGEMMTTSRLLTHTAWLCLHKFGTGWGVVEPV